MPVLIHVRPPSGQSPIVIHDSTIICEYLDDAYPDAPQIMPKDAAGRAKARIIDDAMDTHFESITWAINEVLAFNRAGPSGSSLRKQIMDRATAEILDWYEWLESQLEKPFFCGADFTLADMAVVSVMMGSAAYRIVPEKGTKLGVWWEAVSRRPSVKQLIQANVDETKSMKAAVGSFSTGAFRRQYRDHRLEFMVRAGGLEIVAQGLEKDNIRFSEPKEFVRVAKNLVKGGKAWEGIAKL